MSEQAPQDGAGTPTTALLASRPVHAGRIVNLSIDTVRFPDGSVGQLEMIRHSGAAAVLPLLDSPSDPDPRVLLIRQYRYAGGGFLFEVPAGRPHFAGEDWAICAGRELEEETGFVGGTLTFLTSILTTPGFTDERIHLFLATDLRPGRLSRDQDEFIEPVEMRLSEAVEMVRDGRIVDAKTISTVMYVKQFVVSA